MTDRKAYTVDSLDGDPFALMMAILTFIRAHEESELKGRRVRAAWDNKRRRAVEEGTPLTKRTPGWLVVGANGKYRLDPRRAGIVRRIFRMALSGVGQHAIAEKLNREKVKPFSAHRWHRSYVKKLLENPAVIGRLIAHRVEYLNGRKVRKPVVEVEGLFPSVISLADWTRVQEMRDTGKSGSRSRSAPKGEAPLQNILAGIARCPKCEGTMTRVSKGPTGGYPYLICAKAKAGAGCDYKSVRMESVEDALHQNFDYLLGTIPTGDEDVDDRLQQIDTALLAMSEQASNVTAAIAERGVTGALGDRLARLEQAIGELEAEQKEILAKLQDSPLLNLKIDELDRELSAPKPDRRRVNALLRQMARAVIVDYRYGSLVFQWKHGGESRVTYAWPAEPASL